MRIKLDKADIEFSLFIRTRDKWKCQRCFKDYSNNKQGLQCSHYWPRWREGTRYENDNCMALCFGCHQRLEGEKQGEYKELMEKKLGAERMKTLEIQAHNFCKKDRKLKYIIFKKLNENNV